MASSDVQAAKTVLHEIATHSYSLGMGLQNAAPSPEQSQPSKSFQYLFEISAQLTEVIRIIDEKFPAVTSQNSLKQ